MTKSLEEIKLAETQCIEAVVGGMKLMFALKKYGLDYTSKGHNRKHYSRLRREIRIVSVAKEQASVAKKCNYCSAASCMHVMNSNPSHELQNVSNSEICKTFDREE